VLWAVEGKALMRDQFSLGRDLMWLNLYNIISQTKHFNLS